MKHNCDISVCVLFYNHEKYVFETMENLYNQDYKNFEIIIRDDFSKDKTVDRIKDFLRRNNREDINVILDIGKENIGIIRSINKTLNLSSGSIIIFNGGDDISTRFRISKEVDLLRNYNADLVFSNAKTINEDGSILKKSFYYNDESNLMNYFTKHHNIATKHIEKNAFLIEKVNESIIGSICYGGFGIVFKRDLLEDFNYLFPESIEYEDRFLTFLANLKGLVIYDNEPLVLYRRTNQNFSLPIVSGYHEMKKQIVRLTALETNVCREQLEFIEKHDINDKYCITDIRDFLNLELNKNMLIIKTLDKNYYKDKTRKSLVIKLMKNRKNNLKKATKVFFIQCFPLFFRLLLIYKYSQRRKHFNG